VSVQKSITRHGLAGAEEIQAAMDRVSNHPPERVSSAKVASVVDYRTGGEKRPAWLENTSLVQLTLDDGGRILVRPSGTEPKLKIYVDMRRPVAAGEDVWSAERKARSDAAALAEAMSKSLGFS
jgi:phosphomannomutase